MVIKPWESQIELADETYLVIKENGLAYLAAEERTGKSLASILVFEKSEHIKRVLILTKKKALDGWNETLSGTKEWRNTRFDVTNYHGACKVDPTLYDAVILDEAHAYLSAYPKRGKIWVDVNIICHNKPILYVSATPHAQGVQLLYNQFALSNWSPWRKYKNFYKWYEKYAERDKNGNTEKIYIQGRYIETYKRVNTEKALRDVAHLFITKTRAELGFEHEPEDKLHYIELSTSIKDAYNTLIKEKVLPFINSGKEYILVADTGMKLRTSLHMLEGGVLKVDDDYIILGNTEKIDYIKAKWGDNDNLAIMYQYIAEGDKLREAFKYATILQGTSYAEGVDLSHIEHLVVYSQDFSTAKHTQRRARQANKNRTSKIIVHFLLVKKAISEQVYKTVSVNKQNFVDSVFDREEL